MIKTRLKENSVLDREPKNYSNFAKLLQFFRVFVNLIQFLTESKTTICMKSIYSRINDPCCVIFSSLIFEDILIKVRHPKSQEHNNNNKVFLKIAYALHDRDQKWFKLSCKVGCT